MGESETQNGPVLVAGHAATSVLTFQYNYCNFIM